MISFDRRQLVAKSSAASTASVPEPTKNALTPDGESIGASLVSRSASSTMGRIRYRVEVWAIFSACSVRTWTSCSTTCPEIVVTIPPKKSRYSLPAPSHTRVPSARTSSMGSL